MWRLKTVNIPGMNGDGSYRFRFQNTLTTVLMEGLTYLVFQSSPGVGNKKKTAKMIITHEYTLALTHTNLLQFVELFVYFPVFKNLRYPIHFEQMHISFVHLSTSRNL